MFDALIHEFVGQVPLDSAHHSQLFPSQRLCNIDYLHEYYCVMQKLLYQATYPHNVAYLRYYIASMPGKIPDLLDQYIQSNNIQIESLSFAALQQLIITLLQKECAAKKAKKNFKKQMNFSTKLCNNFAETYDFGCHKNSRKNTASKQCHFPPNKYGILPSMEAIEYLR